MLGTLLHPGDEVRQTTSLWRGLRARLWRERTQVTHALRLTVAAVTTLALAQLLQLPLPLWAVLTAVIVTQMSVGRSLKATIDYLIGTLAGVVYGGAVAVLVPHSTEAALLGAFTLGVAPLMLLASLFPRFAAAPVTAIIVLLVPENTFSSPIASVLDRLLEVLLGGATGFTVSLALLPSRAHRQVAETAAHTLHRMARALRGLLGGLTRGFDIDTLHRIQDGIGDVLAQLQTVGAEAERERSAHLASGAETGPLLRTLLRLRHDMVMIGRAGIVPLPESLRPRLQAPLEQITTAFTDYLSASGAALLARRPPPSLDAVETALAARSAAIAALREDGLTRELSSDAAERLFAIGFALEQMHQNFKDLARCVSEWAERPGGAEAKAAGGEAAFQPREQDRA